MFLIVGAMAVEKIRQIVNVSNISKREKPVDLFLCIMKFIYTISNICVIPDIFTEMVFLALNFFLVLYNV